MCGIIGVVGEDQALPVLLEGLRRLEYRGYDSAGVAVVDGGLTVVKRAGKLEVLDKALSEGEMPAGTVGLGHTRWATHGGPYDHNAHPHTDCSGGLALIHNGIIENYLTLRAELEAAGHTFVSETDTEVLTHLVEEAFDGSDLTGAVRAALAKVEGAFSVAVVHAETPRVIVAAKRTSPLIVGRGERGVFLASDPTALLAHTREVTHMLDDQVVTLSDGQIELTDLQGRPAEGETITIDWDTTAAEKSGFDTFMLKEIYEQPRAVEQTLRGRTRADGSLKLDELRISEEELRGVNKIFIVACGTAFHAGLTAKYALEHWCRIPVEIEIASEFRYRDPILGPETLVIAVSQSGETIDTLEAVKWAKQQGARVMAVCNVVGSSVAREADAVLYTHAEAEVGVAATKTFTTQLVGLKLLALYLAQVRRSLFPSDIAGIVDDLWRLPELIEKSLDTRGAVQQVAPKVADARSVIFIGRHVGYPAALEGALKLKEISYLHAEGFAAGELKHGPIALIEEGVPVVAVATRCHVYSKVLSNIQEVKARGAFVVAVCSEGDGAEVGQHADVVVEIPEVHELLVPALVAVPLQFLAYEVATLKGCDVDQPRNLAKSVTVE
ncbi:MAG: glutamine--fructose-6-phosphate transaminase (isomerizing) [Actinomycetota bacterium]